MRNRGRVIAWLLHERSNDRFVVVLALLLAGLITWFPYNDRSMLGFVAPVTAAAAVEPPRVLFLSSAPFRHGPVPAMSKPAPVPFGLSAGPVLPAPAPTILAEAGQPGFRLTDFNPPQVKPTGPIPRVEVTAPVLPLPVQPRLLVEPLAPIPTTGSETSPIVLLRPVPEPATWLMLVAGVLGVGFYVRRAIRRRLEGRWILAPDRSDRDS